jgi:peptide/nickel transport system substrate-binding protein
MKMKKMMFVFSIFMVVAMLAACGTPATPAPATAAPATAAPAQPATAAPATAAPATAAPAAAAVFPKVTVAIGADPADLSPFSGMNLGRIAILKTTYEYLVESDSMGAPAVPMLAKSVEKTGDMSYVVTLFDYISDSAGNHITAADAAWSYNTGIAAGKMRPLGNVASVKATGDYTVEFVFKTALGVGDLDKALSECPIISQKAYEASKDQMATDPVTTGPYALKQFVPGSSLTYEKRADYWQKPELTNKFSQANVQTIVFQVITEPAQNAIALQTGTADISASVSSTDVAQFQSGGQYADKFTVFQFLDNLTWSLAFNGSEATYQNKDLRQAIAYAIDTKAMCQALGSCAPAHTVGNSNFGGYQTKWDTEPYYDFDLAKAQALFASSGHKSGDLTMKLLVSNSSSDGLVAQIIQADLKPLGITVNIDAEEVSVYNQAMYDPKAFDAALVGGAGGDFIISPWLLMFDQNRNNGTTGQFFKDDKLQSLLMTVSSVDGYTPENIDAFHQYQKDQAYVKALYSWINNIVAAKSITKVVRDTRGQIIPGACEYSK